VIAGIYASHYFGVLVANHISKFFSFSPHTATAVACCVIFAAVVIGLNILASVLTKLFKATGLGWLNRLAGGLFGGIKFLLIVSILLNLVSLFYEKVPIKKENKLSESKFYEPIKKVVPTIIPFVDFDFWQKHNEKADS